MNRADRWCWVLLVAALASGCGSSAKRGETASAKARQAPVVGENVLTELDALEAELERQRSLDAALLAPSAFTEAEKQIRQARATVSGKGSLSDLDRSVSAARGHLDEVRRRSAVLRGPLSGALQARSDAIIAGSASSKGFLETDKEFRESASDIDVRKPDQAKIAKLNTGLESKYRAIELAAIQNRFLADARQLLARAEHKGAKELVPETYEGAVSVLREAQRYIQHNPYDAKENGRRASEAAFEMRRLNALADRAAWIRSRPPEEVALWMESRANELRSELGLGDFRDRSLNEQFDLIAAGVSSLDFTNQQLSNQNEEMRSRLGRRGRSAPRQESK